MQKLSAWSLERGSRRPGFRRCGEHEFPGEEFRDFVALLYLKACLVERNGHAFGDVQILEFGPDTAVDDIVRGLVAAQPDVVGFS